jgi:hypothetical protein
MTKLLLLPITLPLRIVRATAEISFGVARGVLDAVLPDEDDRGFPADDVFARPASAPSPREPEPEPEIPSLDVLEGDVHVDVPEEVVAASGPERSPGAELRIDEPWTGYDAMALDEVLARLGDASEAELAIVRLYERQHENRQAVLLATGEEP